VEEAQAVNEESWEILIPTIRKEGSEIWVSFNPDREEDATYQRFVVNPPRDCKSVLINYTDNPWFPDVLRREMEYCKEVDYGKYEHVWLGKTVINTEAQVYHDKFEMKDFETPPDSIFYFGADWGFANDPTAITRCFIQDQCLYIDYEAGGVGVEFEELPALFESIPEVHKWQIRADNARPETISYVKRQGFNIVDCPKWKGSVEDGVEYIRSFRRIYIHPRCPRTYNEFKFYSYKQDRNTGEILPIILDKDNHYLDSLRYGLNPYIQKNVSILDVL
jgi:phage terminase large subunit